MALKAHVLGLGIYNNFILRGTINYVPDDIIILDENIKIGFYSILGAYIGSITNQNNNCGYIYLKLKHKYLGGLDSFEFGISKLPNFTFFNQMVVRFFINGIHWFTGELAYKSDQETKDPVKKYTGDGYIKYFKSIKIKETYTNKSIKAIAEDVLTKYIIDDTPLSFNSADITPYNYSISSIEFNNKSVYAVFETLNEISNQNYNDTRYHFYIDENLFIHFNEISQEVIKGFFEGFDFQDPKIKVNTKNLINQIDLFRNKSDSQDTEWVSTIINSESQDVYGLKQADFNFNDYADKEVCEAMAYARIERYKNELIELTTKNLKINEKLDIGMYKIATRRENYTIQVSNFSDFLEWDMSHINYTTFSIDDTEALSGRKSMKIVTTNGSNNEYIEKTLNEVLFFPKKLSLYLKQNITGAYVYLRCYDEDDNFIGSGETEPAYLLLENGGYLLLENGGKFELESSFNTFGVNVMIIGTWYRYTFDISSLKNVAKIRIYFMTNEDITLWIDRMENEAVIWKHNTLQLNEIEYEFSRTGLLADAVFGEKNPTIIDTLKELNDKNEFITKIFNKT